MVRSDEHKRARLPGAALDAFAPLTAEPKGAPPEPPRTELGRKLWEIRRKIVESGAGLLDWDQIEAEVASRRGERA